MYNPLTTHLRWPPATGWVSLAPVSAQEDRSTDSHLGDLAIGYALSDLEDDFFRTGDAVPYADVDRAAERHSLSASEHADLVERAVAAGYLVETDPREVEAPVRGRRSGAAGGDLDSFTLLLRDVVRYPLLDAKGEVELARAIEAGARADEERGAPGANRSLDELVERGLAAKRRLVACNIRLVINNARGFRGQGLELGDLVQAGTLGLIRAAEKFDWRLGFKFSTYATWWIRQSIARQLADTGRLIRLPVHIVDRVNRLRREAKKLEQRLGREPEVEELAEVLAWEPVEVAFLRDVSRDPLSLDAPLASAETILADLVASTAPDTEGVALAAMVADDLRSALDVLSPRQREVLVLRYGLDEKHPRTLEEIGQLHSVTRERIRQIEQAAKEKLEKVLLDRGYGPE
jgi:RNA polymerase primary sigma factor